MKHVLVCFSAREDRKANFHLCRGPVRLMQACLCGHNAVLTSQGSAVKHLQSCLSAGEDLESSFQRCGGPLRLVQACLRAGKI